MSKPLTTFAVNARVTHAIYGLGTVADVTEPYTVIDFDQGGRRKFVTSMVQLEPSTVVAPTRTPTKARPRAAKAKK